MGETCSMRSIIMAMQHLKKLHICSFKNFHSHYILKSSKPHLGYYLHCCVAECSQRSIQSYWKQVYRRHFYIQCVGIFKKYNQNVTFQDSLTKLYSGRPPGGARPLTDPADVYEFNNWDDVDWDEEQENEAKRKIEINSKTPVSEDNKEKYEKEADQFWDAFYTQHQNRFFKDRHWLFTEFPELAPENKLESSQAESEVQHSVTSDSKTDASAHAKQENIKDNCVEDSKESDVQSVSKDDCATSAVACESTHNLPVKGYLPDCTSLREGETYPGENAKMRLFEVGCGVGNTVFPILQTNNDPNLFIYCCDLSSTAVELVKEHKDYATGRCHGFVCDVTNLDAPVPFPENSLDIIILIFVLSAVHPDKMQETINRLSSYLKPGGTMLFRDYGRYDMAQLRFKDGRCLSDNFYVRGDGTRVYFFTQEELGDMFTKAGLVKKQNHIDRRLQVNRGRQLKMYRVWIQCKYTKPETVNT